MLCAVRKMKLTARFTYVIIVGVAISLLGRLFYFPEDIPLPPIAG
jgi:hypothetical protein